jgi:hypothetical protein
MTIYIPPFLLDYVVMGGFLMAGFFLGWAARGQSK